MNGVSVVELAALNQHGPVSPGLTRTFHSDAIQRLSTMSAQVAEAEADEQRKFQKEYREAIHRIAASDATELSPQDAKLLARLTRDMRLDVGLIDGHVEAVRKMARWEQEKAEAEAVDIEALRDECEKKHQEAKEAFAERIAECLRRAPNLETCRVAWSQMEAFVQWVNDGTCASPPSPLEQLEAARAAENGLAAAQAKPHDLARAMFNLRAQNAIVLGDED